MPGMNGPTLAERVAALRPGLPIIRMSGSDDTARARPHYTPGSEQAYIQKPFTASDLIGKVRTALAEAAARPAGPAARLTIQPPGNGATARNTSISATVCRYGVLPPARPAPLLNWPRSVRCCGLL